MLNEIVFPLGGKYDLGPILFPLYTEWGNSGFKVVCMENNTIINK